ncbi:MAG: serine/threonine protein phosphatase [Planctomycetaceae bacterium]|jgi:serine/threonine protein phosphatase 1|nr:serine/threonine protein phosphatase [Planctomycetaceae bacterium]MBT6157581.1 serine/threonine protein phosphatase [Planctomycetaceae bacterium]MBT6486061.1 serine/threonine protein phosphatase [Planctomycetaceae bacterium]MBT6497843.1 serine/threonine protein phosphatase [Planctomycetaceae bacterium]
MPGRTLAIGDIHGCDFALETLLQNVQPVADDTVVVLGDVVDRGPDTRRAIDLLLELCKTCELKFILGNHEEMMLKAYHTGEWMREWLTFGGEETLASYGGSFADVLPEHFDFLASGLNYWETETEIFVHATLDSGVPPDLQTRECLRWERLQGDEPPHDSGRTVICGHTSQRSGKPLVFDGWICIDTWVYGDGWLTCLDTSAELVYRSKQDGSYEGPVALEHLVSD